MWLILTIAGFLSATISATIGMAGGTFLLAIMLVVGLPPFVVIPLHAAVQLVSNCTRVVVFREHLKLKPFYFFSFLWLQVPLLGCTFLKDLPADTTRIILALFIVYATWVPKWGLARLPENAAFAFAGDFVRPVRGCYWGCGSHFGPFLFEWPI